MATFSQSVGHYSYKGKTLIKEMALWQFLVRVTRLLLAYKGLKRFSLSGQYLIGLWVLLGGVVRCGLTALGKGWEALGYGMGWRGGWHSVCHRVWRGMAWGCVGYGMELGRCDRSGCHRIYALKDTVSGRCLRVKNILKAILIRWSATNG